MSWLRDYRAAINFVLMLKITARLAVAISGQAKSTARRSRSSSPLFSATADSPSCKPSSEPSALRLAEARMAGDALKLPPQIYPSSLFSPSESPHASPPPDMGWLDQGRDRAEPEGAKLLKA